MPRKAKGVHTSPATAGIQNFTKEDIKRNANKSAEDNTMVKILPMLQIGLNRQDYAGKWSRETLQSAILDYFTYTAKVNHKPSKAGLCIYLNLSKQQLWDWEKNPAKYGFKSELVNLAGLIIEDSYVTRAEKYPTANIFLLKSSHAHIESSKLDITTDGQKINDQTDIKDIVAKLGLDKK